MTEAEETRGEEKETETRGEEKESARSCQTPHIPFAAADIKGKAL